MTDTKNESLTTILQEKLIVPVQQKFKSLTLKNEELKIAVDSLTNSNKKLKIGMFIIMALTVINAITLFVLTK